MKKWQFLVYCVLLSQALQAARADTGLQLSADTPTAHVTPQVRGRASFALPELEYQFRIDALCRDKLAPASVSVAVADSRRTFDSKQIESGELQAVRLRIPANQIPPVVVTDFCTDAADPGEAADPVSPQRRLTIGGALAAQASLLCLGDDSPTMQYASALLDVTLECVDGSIAADAPALQ